MSNYWNQPGVPHKGWSLVSVVDLRADGQSADETDYQTCMMCGNYKIRYVHILEHPDIDGQFSVGCMCAEKLTDDYVNPKLRERRLKIEAGKKERWINRKWLTTPGGSIYLKLKKHKVGIYFSAKLNGFICKIDKKSGSKVYDEMDKAKIGLYSKIIDLREKGEW